MLASEGQGRYYYVSLQEPGTRYAFNRVREGGVRETDSGHFKKGALYAGNAVSEAAKRGTELNITKTAISTCT